MLLCASFAKNIKDWGIKFTVKCKQTQNKHWYIDLSTLIVARALSSSNLTFSLVWPLRQESLDIELDWTQHFSFPMLFWIILSTQSLIMTYSNSKAVHRKCTLSAETKMSAFDRKMPKPCPCMKSWCIYIYISEIKLLIKKAKKCNY